MKSTVKPRIGLIGCGEWGKLILRDLKTLGCHVSVVARSEKSRQYAQTGGADVIIDNIEALNNVQGIVIATVTSNHAQMIDQVVHAYPNIPIFVEKPLTADLTSAENIAANYGDRIFVMHKWQYHNGILALANIVATHQLGQLIGIHLTRFSTANNHPDVDIIWTCMPHDLSIVHEILGHIPPLRAAHATQWENETMSLTSVWGENPWVQIAVSTIRQAKQREVRIECEHGIAVLGDGYAEHIEIYKRIPHTHALSQTPEILDFQMTMPLFDELHAFVNYINGGEKPKADAQQGLDVVRAITQARTLAGISHSGILI